MSKNCGVIEVEDLAVVTETDLAFKVTDGKVTVWLPKSQCEQIDDATFSMPEWLALDKGLI